MGRLHFACRWLLLLPVVVFASASLAAERLNVLFIAVDDLRPALGCYGDSLVQSPHMDGLAKRGLVLERAYCQQAVCSPSRSSVMTGARPDTTKVWDLKTHFRDALPNVMTLGQHFRQHGYFVQGMGKIFHPGYDDKESWSVAWQHPEAPTYALPENRASNQLPPESSGKRRQRGPAFESADVPDHHYRDGKVADLAVETLRELRQRRASQQQPFFLAVGFSKPHLPFIAPQRYADLYDAGKFALASNPFRPRGAPPFAILDGNELRNYRGIPDGPLPDDLARQLKHHYYACVSYLDAQVGRVLEELDRLELARDTVVVLWGDHGWKLGEHQAWCKHSNVELDTRVPLILAAPGRTDLGLRSRALVELVDIYPTLSELADLPLPEHLEGTSFVPLLQDPDRPWKKAAFSQYPRPAAQTDTGPIMGYSMRTDRYRLTRWVHRDDRQKFVATELYDHASDPDENTNLADDGGSADLVLRLTQQLNGGWRAARPEAPRPAGNDPQGSAHPSPPATAIPRAGGKPSAT
jgi:arylsulfatase A-like enzyme